jgi:hypothetical protein
MKNILLLLGGILGFLIFPFLEWENQKNDKKNEIQLTVFCKIENAEISEKLAIRKIESFISDTRGLKKFSVDINKDFAHFRITLKEKVSKSQFALSVTEKIRENWKNLQDYIFFPDWTLDHYSKEIQIKIENLSHNYYISEKNSDLEIINSDKVPQHYLNGLPAKTVKTDSQIFHNSFWILLGLGFLYPKLKFIYIHLGTLGLILFSTWLFESNITEFNIYTLILIQIWGLYSIIKNSRFWWSEIIFFFLILISNPNKDWTIIYGLQLLSFNLLKWGFKKPYPYKLSKKSILVLIPLSFCTWPELTILQENEVNNDLRIQFGNNTPPYLVEELYSKLIPITEIKNIQNHDNKLIEIEFKSGIKNNNYPQILRRSIEKWLNHFSGFEFAIYGFGKNQLNNQESKQHNLSFTIYGYDYDQLRIKAFELSKIIKENPRVSELTILSGSTPLEYNSIPKITALLNDLGQKKYSSITHQLNQMSGEIMKENENGQIIFLSQKNRDPNELFLWKQVPNNLIDPIGTELVKNFKSTNEKQISKINQKFLLTIQFNLLGGVSQANQFKEKFLQYSESINNSSMNRTFSNTEKAWGLFILAFLLNFGFSLNLWSSLIGGIPIFGNFLAHYFFPEISIETWEFVMFIGFAFSSTVFSIGNIPPLLFIPIGIIGLFHFEFIPIFFQLILGKLFFSMVFLKQSP